MIYRTEKLKVKDPTACHSSLNAVQGGDPVSSVNAGLISGGESRAGLIVGVTASDIRQDNFEASKSLRRSPIIAKLH